MKFILTYFILILIVGAQDFQAQTINKRANFIECDALGNIYTIETSEISKFNSNGIFQSRYSNNIYGTIKSIDVQNPFKILLFFDDLSTIIFLDQNLTEISESFDIYEKTNLEASLVCQGKDKGIWLYSPVSKTLYKLNQQLAIIYQSQNLNGFFNGNEPFQLIEKNQNLFLVSNKRILVFDFFGTYLHSIFLSDINKISVTTSSLSFYKNGFEMKYHLIAKKLDSLPIANEKTLLLDVKWASNKKVLQFEDRIEIIKQ
ncbi:MAG: hypothetical protein JEZ09_06885 [Salinivirgaceae bacterium]|nr:hypothetical protein [Salinivirgaceae bacterium]